MAIRRVGPLAAAAIIGVAALVGVAAALVINRGGSDSVQVSAQATVGPSAPGPAPTAEAAPPVTLPPAPTAPVAGPSPTAIPTVEPTPDLSVGALFGDDVVAAALARAEAEPPDPDRVDRFGRAQSRLIADLTHAGHDLTDVRIGVFRNPEIGVFAVVETDDSAPLLLADSLDAFVVDFLASGAITEMGVDRLVLRHTTSDEQGPMIVTMTVGVAALRNAVDTQTNVFDQTAVQVERP